MITNMSEALHVMPWAGGLFDQHPYYVEGINMVLSARVERSERDHPKKKK